MGRIPQEFLDQLLGRVDLVEIVNSRVPLRRAGHEFMACCPFHTEKTPSFSVSPRKQFYHCFGCGAHGNAIGFLMTYERLEFLDAVEELARQAGLELPQTGGNDRVSIKPLLLDLVAQADRFFRRQLREHPSRQRAVDYLRQRGLTGQIAGVFGIGYAPAGWENLSRALREVGATAENLLNAGLSSRDEQGRLRDRFRDRIIFPIRDRRGRVIAFGGRALDGETTPKYLNSPETPLFHKGSELYGLHEARMQSQPLPRLLVVEGYMDVVALAQHGLPYTVATLGTATTADQIERLFRVVSDLVFCFDGDRAGRAAAWRALEVTLPFLHDGRQVGFLFLPDGEDPDTLVRREGQATFERRLEQATALADYLFSELRGQTDPETLAGRARLAERARPLLEKLPDGHFRDLMEARLQKEAHLATTRLRPPPAATAVPNRADRNLRLTRTPLRKAVALLLYRPELAQGMTADDPLLRVNSDPGIKLLTELIETLLKHPHLKVATLLERYRDTREGAILERLAVWEPEVPEESYQFAAEFTDILAYLRRRNDPGEQVPEILLRRGVPSALNAEEREAVRNLGKPQKV
ncbi:DNA primase [Candidatus Contendibacter odensensis]|uniref:DNA primase n=1 Tax=Candidatus Contendobacter odensis Run_B_J11 TaxID=1400861 RepID=A0A7U7J335_9GAMM|nr:DNA primase [Candidatus Contendobacter odensis]MBK8752564.1 DNA primase [Candidatus Competibacteraceae bacterium]CDH43813.1 DNA biosynthesis; DNA primase [Candidatus Contendobacter odensis Run_B_J11]